MNKQRLIGGLIISILLSACGGGTNQPKSNNNNSDDTNKDNTTSYWKELPEPYTNFSGLGASFSGKYLYISSQLGSDILKTSGDTTTILHKPKNAYVVNLVDRHEHLYTSRYISEDSFNFTKINHGAYMFSVSNGSVIFNFSIGDSGYRISNKGTNSKEIGFHTYNPNTKEYTQHEGRFKTELATNGFNTFILVPKNNGLFVSVDEAKTFQLKIEHLKGFTAAAGNYHHPSQLFAGRTGELYVSGDEGNTWSKGVSPTYKGKRVTEWIDLELLADGELIALVSLENDVDLLNYFFKSNDFGQSWKLINKGQANFTSIEGNDKYYFATSFGNTNVSLAKRK